MFRRRIICNTYYACYCMNKVSMGITMYIRTLNNLKNILLLFYFSREPKNNAENITVEMNNNYDDKLSAFSCQLVSSHCVGSRVA